jgi:hypothetical protein
MLNSVPCCGKFQLKVETLKVFDMQKLLKFQLLLNFKSFCISKTACTVGEELQNCSLLHPVRESARTRAALYHRAINATTSSINATNELSLHL